MIPQDKVRDLISKHQNLEKELSSGKIEKKNLLTYLKNIQILTISLIMQGNIFYLKKRKMISKKLLMMQRTMKNL